MLDFFRKNADKIIWGVLIAFVLSIGIIGFSKPQRAGAKNRNLRGQANVQGTLAVVDGREVNSRYFMRMYQSGVNNYRPQEQKDPLDPKIDAFLRYNALMQTIDFEKSLIYAKKLKVKVPSREVNAQIDSIIKGYGLKSKKEFKELLAKNGYSFNDFLKDVKDEMTINKLFSYVKQKAEVADRDVKDQFKRVKARHILIEIPQNKDKDLYNKGREAAREQTAQLYDRLMKGEDFAKLAQEYSADKGSAVKGGDLGWFGAGVMVPEFEQVAFILNKGQISKPIETQYGFHIINVEDIEQKDIPLDVDENELKKKLLEQRQQQAVQQLRQKINGEILDEVFLPEVKAYTYRMNGDFDKALGEYRLLSSQSPQSPVPYIFITEIFENQNKSTEALVEYKKALLVEKLNPAAKSAFLHFYLGKFYAKEKQKKAALAEYKKSEEIVKDDVRFLERLKEAYTDLGYAQNAKKVELRAKAIENSWKVAKEKTNADIDFTETTKNSK